MEIDRAMQTNSPPSEDTFKVSRVPESLAIGYCAMYAHGIHFRILSAEEVKFTYNNEVAACIWQRNRRAHLVFSANLTKKP
jgi:hypothetical protein